MNTVNLSIDVTSGIKNENLHDLDKLISDWIEQANKCILNTPDLKLFLVGQIDHLNKAKTKIKKRAAKNIELIFTDGYHTDEKDIEPNNIEDKTKTSTFEAMNLVKQKYSHGSVSAANTELMMTYAKEILGFHKSYRDNRIFPSIPLELPNSKLKSTLLNDTGATKILKPKRYVDLAIVSLAYCKTFFNNDNPKLGMIANGSEDDKGIDETIEANILLKEIMPEYYVGNLDPSGPNGIFAGNVDAFLCNGYVGNLLLKMAESAAHGFITILKKQIKNPNVSVYEKIKRNVGGLLLKKTFLDYKETLGVEEKNGQHFYGFGHSSFKSHGNTTPIGKFNGIMNPYNFIKNNKAEEFYDNIERFAKIYKK